MIELRKMREEEFSAYRQHSILAHGHDLVDNYDVEIKEAMAMADKKLTEFFPNGVGESDHQIWCIEFGVSNATQLVGYLWYKINQTDKTAFIYDFHVFDDFRGCGIGSQVFSEFEAQLKSQQIEFVNLRVGTNNKRAQKLYKRLAFSVTGYNMGKKIV